MKNNFTKLSKIEKFSLYLFKNMHIESNLKIQKILFFLRIYELENNIQDSPIFEEKNHNFQAWIYGPVNVKSYRYLSPIVVYNQQISDNDIKQIIKENYEKYNKYIKYFDDYYNTSGLVELSHKNLAYKKARFNLKDDEPCVEPLDEESKDFHTFDNGWKLPKL